MVEGNGKEWQWGGATEGLRHLHVFLCSLAPLPPDEKGKRKMKKKLGFREWASHFILGQISVGFCRPYVGLEIQIGPKLFGQFGIVSGLTELDEIR